MKITELTNTHREAVINHIFNEWGEPIVTKGKIIDIRNLQGFAALIDSELAGAILYKIDNGDCEIVALYSTVQSIGVGTNLINAVINMAKKENCKRVWLITMNDITHAIRFYQKRGFDLKAVHINAFGITRKLKNMPLHGDILGIDNIPIRHEFEFEIIL